MADNEYCQLVSILIPKYVKGQCTKSEGGLLGEHCAVCQECRTRLARAFEEAKAASEREEPIVSHAQKLELSKKEIMFLSRPQSLKLSQKSDIRNKSKKKEDSITRKTVPDKAVYTNPERDFAIDWKDRVLESRMREITGIHSRDIMYRDVKDIIQLYLSSKGGDKIGDISALGSLTKLEYLDLSDNKISDISALGNLINLKILDLSGNQISDISVLNSLNKLNYLDLTDNQITDFSQIEHLNIPRVFMEFAKGQSANGGTAGKAPLPDYVIEWKDSVLESRMREITGIHSRDIKYSDVKNITQLYLSSKGGDKISDISALSIMEKLEYLDLVNNEISDISALSNMANLKILDLTNNQINDISVLNSLTNLRVLSLKWNEINDISALKSLKNLTYLNLQSNQIKDYSPIEPLNIQNLII